jgi:glucose-6-phosphate 1-dehydrogenase
MIRRLVIFGASGDLTARHLLPAIAQLVDAGHLPPDITIEGIGRQPWDTEAFRTHVAQKLDRHAPELSAPARQALTRMLVYHRADMTNPDQVITALGNVDAPLIAYLALPPALFGSTINTLGKLGLPDGSRIAVEKPFGEGLTSARDLNRLLHRFFPEEAVFRLDHFLGKQTVQNILGLRFANRLFEPIWNAEHVARVEIVWDETLALEGRATYYDRAGALVDMVQNHLLQLLCLVGMEPPPTLSARDFRDRKVDVLRAVRSLTREEVPQRTVRGRYHAGRIDGHPVPAYIAEPGVDPARKTETFAQVTLNIDNWRWAGVPFSLRTGKALAANRQEIALHFKPVPHLAFVEAVVPGHNILRLTLHPDRIALQINVNGPGDPFTLERLDLEATLAPQDLSPYARILLEVLEGDPTLSIRDDEAEECWRIIEPIRQAWQEGRVPLLAYPAGSHGPTA